MSDQTGSLRDDISFLRNLAEAGRNRPVAGGLLLVASGVIFGLASFLDWAMLTDRIALPLSNSGVWNASWMSYVAVWIAVTFWMRRYKALPLDPTNRIFSIAWSASGFGVLVLVAAATLSYRTFHDPIVFALIPSCVSVFYGAAWLVSAGASRGYWMLAVAAASFAFALLFATMTSQADLTFAFGVAIVLVILLPGIRLMMLHKA